MLENDECGLDEYQREAAYRSVQYYKNGVSHFTESTARGCIAQMYCFTDETTKRYAPFVDYNTVREEYEKVKDDIPDYNLWDFAVTLNLVYSNHADAVGRWTRNKGKLAERMKELAVGFLNDVDTDHPTDKIWWYMNG